MIPQKGSILNIYVGQLSDIEGLDFISSDIGYNFRLKYPVLFGHNNLICELYAYLKYDASHDTFKLYMSQAGK